jgi:hypothetical protein
MALELVFDDAFFSPDETFRAYVLRSHLVHGSPVGLGDPDIEDFVDSRLWWAREILSRYALYAAKSKASDSTELIGELDASEATKRACDWLENQGKLGKQILKEYRREIKHPTSLDDSTD